MEMEVVMPVPAVDFIFDSTCSSPYITAPSTPQRFGNFFLAAAQQHYNDEDEDFEFNFSGQLNRTSLFADELFDSGKIRPLKPSSHYQSESRIATVSQKMEDPEVENMQ